MTKSGSIVVENNIPSFISNNDSSKYEENSRNSMSTISTISLSDEAPRIKLKTLENSRINSKIDSSNNHKINDYRIKNIIINNNNNNNSSNDIDNNINNNNNNYKYYTQEEEFPEGTKLGWSTVIGCFLATIPSSGLVNSVGVLQEYISTNQLSNISATKVGWVFSIFVFIGANFALIVGSLVDTFGIKIPLIFGLIIYILGFITLAFCKEYYQFILSFSLLFPIGLSFFAIGPLVAIGHWFKNKRSFASGIGISGSSIGGVIYPIMLKSLFNNYGYKITIIITSAVSIVILMISILLTHSRLPRRNLTWNKFIDPNLFKNNLPFVYTAISFFFTDAYLFIVLTFLPSYAKDATGFSENNAFYLMSIMNAVAFIGRWLPGKLADLIGPFNVITLTTLIASISIFAIWLGAGNTVAGLYIFSCVFGFNIGTVWSLMPVCCSKLGPINEYGKRFGTAYIFASFGPLICIPVSGALIPTYSYIEYTHLIAFAGVCAFCSFIFWGLARCAVVGYYIKAVY